MHNVRFRLYIASSLDGYIADRGGAVDWLEPFQDVDYGYRTFFEEIHTLVMGRRTWEQSSRAGGAPYGDRRIIVLTARPPEGGENLETWDGGVEELSARLRRETPGDVWVVGGADVVDQFLVADELDEIELYVMPVLLGGGVSLFPRLASPRPLRLVDTREFPNGVVQMRYERPR